MTSAFQQKLEKWAPLSEGDKASIEGLIRGVHRVERNHHLIREGDDPEVVFMLMEGWAYRYKVLPNGKRQIVAFLLPGDLCDIHIFILDQMDHGISMLSPGKVVAIPRTAITELIDEKPTIARALWWTTLVDEAILREWLVNIGGRESYSRMAHLICELHTRLEHVGLVHGNEFELPATQQDLGDALGLTPVHVNRMLKRLRTDGYITMKGRHLVVHDLDGLKQAAGFSSTYLHGRRGGIIPRRRRFHRGRPHPSRRTAMLCSSDIHVIGEEPIRLPLP